MVTEIQHPKNNNNLFLVHSKKMPRPKQKYFLNFWLLVVNTTCEIEWKSFSVPDVAIFNISRILQRRTFILIRRCGVKAPSPSIKTRIRVEIPEKILSKFRTCSKFRISPGKDLVVVNFHATFSKIPLKWKAP